MNIENNSAQPFNSTNDIHVPFSEMIANYFGVVSSQTTTLDLDHRQPPPDYNEVS